MLTYLDNHSRFIPGSAIFENATSEDAIDLLNRCIAEFDAPEQILTDQGTQFHTTQEDGVTEFDRFCRRYKTEHIVAVRDDQQQQEMLRGFMAPMIGRLGGFQAIKITSSIGTMRDLISVSTI